MRDYLIEIGRIVFSKSGRDAGKCFMIFDIIDEDYVYLVDGALRKLGKPKKKKVKHIELKPVRLEQIREKILSGKKVFDSEVRSALENYLNSQN